MTRPRRGVRVAFTREDCDEPRPTNIAGLRFTIAAQLGGHVDIDFVDLQPRRLALAFAKALLLLTAPGGSARSRSTIMHHAHAYGMFFAFLADAARDVRGPEDLRPEHIDGFETWLEANGKRPEFRRSVLCRPLLALRTLDDDDPGVLRHDLKERLRYNSARPVPRCQPRDAYSPLVARRLRDAARADIAAINARIGSGPVAASKFVGVRQDSLDLIHEEIGRIGVVDARHAYAKRIYFQMTMARRTREVGHTVLSIVHRQCYLSQHDLVPFVVLLSLDTGLELECIKHLSTDCLRNPRAGTIEIHYIKHRARGSELKHLRVRDGGLLTPGGLIRTALKLTERARLFLKSERLWLYHLDGAIRDAPTMLQYAVTPWINRHGIRDDKDQPLHLQLSRLRKTHKALWYLKSQGEIARFAVGHTPEVAARHYADIPSLRPLHETTLESAFQDVHDSALGQPRIVTPDEEIAERAAAPIEATALDAAQEVWLARCSGFTASPFAPAGSPCPHAAWACLECPNAIITAAKLPAILGFLDFIEAERAGLSAAAWRAKFGQAHARITTQILPKFSATVLVDARAHVTPPLHLPIELRA
mgnify:CR=1 FL=1